MNSKLKIALLTLGFCTIAATGVLLWLRSNYRADGTRTFEIYVVRPVPQAISISIGGSPPMAGLSFANFTFSGPVEDLEFLSSWRLLEEPDAKSCNTLVQKGSAQGDLVSYFLTEPPQASGKVVEKYLCFDRTAHTGALLVL